MMTLDCTTDTCEQLCEHPRTVCLARQEALPETEAQQVAEAFKLLGDATRIKMLHALAKRELCVCDLAAVVEMGQSAVSHQLRLLRSARLVKYRKEGKLAWYSLDDTHIESLLAQCVEHIRHR